MWAPNPRHPSKKTFFLKILVIPSKFSNGGFLVVPPLPLFVSLNQQSLALRQTRPHTKATCLLSYGFAQFPLALVPFALSRQGIDLLSSGPLLLSSVIVTVHCVVGPEESVLPSLRRCSDWSGTRTDDGALSRKRAFCIDALKRSPEIDPHLRMYSCLEKTKESKKVKKQV